MTLRRMTSTVAVFALAIINFLTKKARPRRNLTIACSRSGAMPAPFLRRYNCVVDALMHELLEWIAARPRTYAETMDAWRSHCPRHSTWEDACIGGLVEVVGSEVALTARGKVAIEIR